MNPGRFTAQLRLLASGREVTSIWAHGVLPFLSQGRRNRQVSNPRWVV